MTYFIIFFDYRGKEKKNDFKNDEIINYSAKRREEFINLLL